MRGVPWISDGREGRVHRRTTEGELVHAEFAEEDRARFPEFDDRRRIAIGKPIPQHRRVASRANSFSGVEVFESDWNAMQRPAIFAAVQFLLGLFALAQIGGNGDETVQSVVGE